MAAPRKPKLAVYKFSSCDGCQLTLLDCEDELLEVAERVEIANFLEASRTVLPGPYDIALVEGSIATPHDAERIHEVRRASKLLVTIGACASAGGIQALRNFAELKELVACVYPTPEYVAALATSTPIAQHVRVDYELRGCPISKRQLLRLLGQLLAGQRPSVPTHSVCIECKRAGNPCLMVASDVACLGPVTQAGCGALCPSYARGCYGCFGPMEAPNVAALSRRFAELGNGADAVVRAFRSFNAGAPAFRDVGESHGPS